MKQYYLIKLYICVALVIFSNKKKKNPRMFRGSLSIAKADSGVLVQKKSVTQVLHCSDF